MTDTKKAQEHQMPSIDDLAEATGGRPNADGDAVIVGYGQAGYLTVYPDWAILGGNEMPAARIEGRLTRQNGGSKAALRDALRESGIYPA